MKRTGQAVKRSLRKRMKSPLRKPKLEKTERRVRDLSALHTVTTAVSASLDLDQLVPKALDVILEVTGMEAGYIRLLEGDPPQLNLRVHRGISPQFGEKLRRGPRAGGKAEQVLTTKRSLIVENSPTSHTEKLPQVLTQGFTTAVWVPITSKEKAVGIINVATRRRQTFDRDQLPLLEAIGASLGVALENARLFHEVEKNTFELGKVNREIGKSNLVSTAF